MIRRRRAVGRVAHTSSGSIGMRVEAPRQRDKLPQSLNAQLHMGFIHRTWLAGRLGDQERGSADMLNLEGGQDVAGLAADPTQDSEASPPERMARIVDRHFSWKGIISFRGGDTPVRLRSTALTGGGSMGPGGYAPRLRRSDSGATKGRHNCGRRR